MKKLLYLIPFIFIVFTSYGQIYQPLTYDAINNPTYGVKIKTNLPFQPGVNMPTIIIEGFNFNTVYANTSETIGIILNTYVLTGANGWNPPYAFYQYNASSYGAYTPVIKLANENNKLVIFLDSRTYALRFMVRAFAKGQSEQASWYEGWTTVDEPLTGSPQVTVVYKNRFKDEVLIDGKLRVGGASLYDYDTNLAISRPLSAAGFSTGINNSGTIKKGVTTAAYYNSVASTGTDTVNVENLYHYSASQGTLGANSSVANQYGFFVQNTMASAANNYGFYSKMPKGTGKWDLFLEAADNYMGGNLGIGITNPTARLEVRASGSTAVAQSSPLISARGTRNNFEFGHPSTAGLASTLGAIDDGLPFLCFNCEAGTTANTFRTRGFVGTILGHDLFGGLIFGRIKNNNADNQQATVDLILKNGNLGMGTSTPVARIEVVDANIGGASQSNPLIAARGRGNNFEFGHSNAAGFGSILGANATDGKPFLCFNCEAGTNLDTYRTRGKTGTIIRGDLSGGLIIGRVTNANSDNQTATPDLVLKGGQLGIGTSEIPIDYKLAIAGSVIAEKIKVKKQVNGVWPDYVFSTNYKLPRLEDVETFTKQNRHLPEIPSAKEVEKEGQDLGEMNRLLLKKVEELTLYMIEQNKEIKALKLKVEQLEKK